MKYKVQNSAYWLSEKPEKNISTILKYYSSTVLAKLLSPEQCQVLAEVLKFEKEHQTSQYGASYMPIFELSSKEPLNAEINLSDVDMLIEIYHPMLDKLKKIIAPLEDDKTTTFIEGGSEFKAYNFYYGVNNRIKALKSGSKLVKDIYNKKIVLENALSEASIETYTQGIKSYVCGTGNLFYNAQRNLVKLNNAHLFESKEAANQYNPGSCIFELEVKLVSPSLTKASSADNQINSTLQKNALEANLEHKSGFVKKRKI